MNAKRGADSGGLKAAGGDAPLLKGEFMDLSSIALRKHNERDPAIFIKHRSSTGETLVAAVPLIHEASVAAGCGTSKPPYLAIARIEGDPNTVAAVPVLRANTSTLPVTWVEDGTRARIDMQALLLARHFTVPRGTRAYIPVAPAQLEEHGPCILLQFGEVTFEPIEEGKRKKAAAKKQGSEAKAAAAAGGSTAPTGDAPKPEAKSGESA